MVRTFLFLSYAVPYFSSAHIRSPPKTDSLYQLYLSSHNNRGCCTQLIWSAYFLPCTEDAFLSTNNMQTCLSQGAPRCPPEAARHLSRPYRAASGSCHGHCCRHTYNLKQRPDAAYTASLSASYGA